MLFKKILERFRQGSTTEIDIDFLNLFTGFPKNTSEDEDRIFNTLKWAKDKGYLDDLKLSDEGAKILLRSFLDEGNLPEALLQNEALRKEIRQVITKRAALTSDEVDEATELISTGELFKDVGYSISVLFSLVAQPDRFSNPGDNVKKFIGGLLNLPGAIVADLNPSTVTETVLLQFEQIRSGQTLEDPKVLDNTLAGIYSMPEIGNVINTANALLDQENESLRLALTIYARLNGINLTQKDINTIKTTLLNQKKPKLGSLLVYISKNETRSRLTV